MNNIDNTSSEIMDKKGAKESEINLSEFKKTDWLLFWLGVILIAVGIPNLLDVLSTILIGNASSEITDLIVSLLYTIVGGWLFVIKKKKLKQVSDEKIYKKTIKTVYIVIGVFFLILLFSVLTLFSF